MMVEKQQQILSTNVNILQPDLVTFLFTDTGLSVNAHKYHAGENISLRNKPHRWCKTLQQRGYVWLSWSVIK